MKAKIAFEAHGQRARSLGMKWGEVKASFGLYQLPMFAQAALAKGHMQQSRNQAAQRGGKDEG